MIDHFGAPWVAPDTYRLRDDARRFETWENNYAARLGLGVAVDYALALGLEAIEARCRALASQLRDGLRQIPGATLLRPGPAPGRDRQLHARPGSKRTQIKSLCSRRRRERQHVEAIEHPARRDRAAPADPRPRLAALLQHAKRRSSGCSRSCGPLATA